MKDTGQAFTGLEEVLRENFLHRLLSGKPKTLPSIVVALSMLTVKKSGMVLQNPVTSAEEKFTSSLCTSDKLIGAVEHNKVFKTSDHIRRLEEIGLTKQGIPRMTQSSRESSATKAFSKLPYPTHQTNRCLAERMGYHG